MLRRAVSLGLVVFLAAAGVSARPLGDTLDRLSATVRAAEPLPAAEARAAIDAAFEQHEPGSVARKAAVLARARAEGRRIAADQEAGRDRRCSNQIYLELVWRARYTVDFAAMERRFADLERSYAIEDQSFAAAQSPITGAWGVCFEPLFMRVEASVLALYDLEAQKQAPRYAIAIAPQVRTGGDLVGALAELVVSDIARDGVDHRAELGALVSYLSQIHFKPFWQRYLDDKVVGLMRHRDPGGVAAVTAALRGFIDAWQSPDSGYWGAHYLIDGRLRRTDDLSMTYHIISYLRGDVKNWPAIIETTLGLEDKPYPYGLLHEGRYTNHNLYDLAKIYRFAWPHMTEAQRERAGAQIERALNWTLEHSIDADGRFRSDEAMFSSIAADYYFGVAFLDAIGFFEPNDRFWTRRAFPEAFAVCALIRDRLEAARLAHELARSARRKLIDDCPPG